MVGVISVSYTLNDNLVATLQAVYKKMFVESQNNYEVKSLAELCSKIGSGATPKGGKSAYSETGISLIRSTNVFDLDTMDLVDRLQSSLKLYINNVVVYSLSRV